MQISQVYGANSFGAKFSPELANKVKACGKFLLRTGANDEYQKIYEAAQEIKTIFPDGKISLKQFTHPETIYGKGGKPLFSIPVSRYHICLEREAERDINLLPEDIPSSTFMLMPKQILEMRDQLRAYFYGALDRGYDMKNDKLLIKKVRELV